MKVFAQMTKRRGRSITNLLAAWLVVFSVHASHAQTLELQLPDVEGNVGTEVTIPIEVANIAGKGVIAATIRVAYDPAILSDAFTVSIDETVAEGDGGFVQGVRATSSSPPKTGYFTLNYYRNATVPISEDGVFFELSTDVIGEGTTALQFTFVLLETISGSAEYEAAAGSFTTDFDVPDTDGIDVEVEDAVPNPDGGGTGDGNGDGVPDSEQANVASFPNETDGNYVTIASSTGTRLVNVSSSATPPAPAPDDADLVDGVLSFEVTNLDAGGETTVTIFTSNEVNGYLKYGPTPDDPSGHWYDFSFNGTTGAEILSDRIVLHFVDGLRGDGDLSANGEIDDPGAPVFYSSTTASAEEDELPGAFKLRGNYPNPFNPSTTVRFDLAENAEVGVNVYDLLGRHVMSVPPTTVQAGADRSVRIEASTLTSGTYVYRVIARTASDTMVRSGHMTLVK